MFQMTLEREQRLKKLFDRTHAGIKPGLSLMEELLEVLENPHRDFLSVHVAGTNGKGSTCALLESAVRCLGLKSGLFTSPHLIRVNERIQIDGLPMEDDLLDACLREIQNVEKSLSRLPTFFETLTAAAFLGFKASGVQVAVLETGLGGRLDSTNVVEPLLSVITRVDFDHQSFLGDTLAEIAGEKAGIIKPGRPVVLGSQQEEAERVLIEKAQSTGSVLVKANEMISISGRKQDIYGQSLNLSGNSADYGKVKFPLLGKFQLENLCTAVAAMEVMEEQLGVEADPARLKKSVENVKWPGRGQMLSTSPPILLDVAHNIGGAHALKDLLEELFGRKAKGTLFWAGLADKDPRGFIETLSPMFSHCICMELQSPRAMSAKKLAKLACREGLPTEVMTLGDAKIQAMRLVKSCDFGCVAGSVYLAGEWLGIGTSDPSEMGSSQISAPGH